jgi:chromosome segregation ATPase
MYEPYGEEKKGLNLKEKLNRTKQKLQEKFKNLNLQGLKLNKVSIILLALGLLLVTGTISGYITYTGRISNLRSDNLVLQKQNDALQTEMNDFQNQLATCNSNLQTTNTELESLRQELAQMTLDYETTETDLGFCEEEKLTLSEDLNLANEELEKKQNQYDTLKANYDELEDDLETVECNYAKEVCSSMEYYFVDGQEVFCCLRDDPEFCTRDPDGAPIKQITC